jgi:hypothetical protein
MIDAPENFGFPGLSPEELTNIAAAVHVEGKAARLVGSPEVTDAQLDKAKAHCRQMAYNQNSPAARKVIEEILRQEGILVLDHAVSPTRWHLSDKLRGPR